MKLTLSVGYAIGVLLQIHRLDGDGHFTAAKIAKGCRFPPRFLYRILRRLVDGGLLNGTSGPGGGYALARPANQISLLDVVSSVESAPEASELTSACADHREAIATLNRLCAQSADQFTRELEAVSLADLVQARSRRTSRASRPKKESSRRPGRRGAAARAQASKVNGTLSVKAK